jgi:large subunit ribosomal protein L21
MYAVIRTGGKQYRVAKDDVIVVERLGAPKGEVVELGEVLMLAGDGTAAVGAPFVPGASVAAAVLEHRQNDKVIVFKKKRRHNYRRKRGHRQEVTVLRVAEILTDGRKPDRAAILAALEAETAAKAAKAKSATPPARSAVAAEETAPQAEPAKKAPARKAPAKKAPAKKASVKTVAKKPAPKASAKKPAPKKKS